LVFALLRDGGYFRQCLTGVFDFWWITLSNIQIKIFLEIFLKNYLSLYSMTTQGRTGDTLPRETMV